MRRFALALSVCLTGFATSELIYRSVVCRDLIGRTFGRGHLIALTQGNGVYGIDLRREKEADDSPDETTSHHPAIDAALRSLSRNEPVTDPEVARECDLVRSQFGNERTFVQKMRANGFSKQSLRAVVTDNLKVRQWIERRLAGQAAVTEEECREFYRTHLDAFALPVRLRASHLFLAAPPETPAEVVESKRLAMESLSQRIGKGEDFSALAAEASEDEATKGHGGDLGFFTSSRMPPEFLVAATSLRAGELSKPVRSRLGFHIIQLTAIEPARVIPFEKARAQIVGILQNNQRRFLTGELMAKLVRETEYFGTAR